MRARFHGVEGERLIGLGANQRHRLLQRTHAHQAEQEITQAQARMRLGVAGVDGHCPLEPDPGWCLRCHCVAEHELTPTKQRLMGGKLWRVAVPRRRWHQRDLQRFGNRPCDFVLNGEDVRHLTVVPLGPEMAAVSSRNELCGHAKATSGFADAPFENGRHSQHVGDSTHVLVLAFEGERRRAGDHLEARNSRQGVDDLFGQAVAEVFVLLVAAHVLERQHRDRRSLAGGLRSQLLQCRRHFSHRLESPRRSLLQAGTNETIERGRLERWRLVTKQSTDHAGWRLALERAAARHHLVEHRAKAEDVRAHVERFALGLLR